MKSLNPELSLRVVTCELTARSLESFSESLHLGFVCQVGGIRSTNAKSISPLKPFVNMITFCVVQVFQFDVFQIEFILCCEQDLLGRQTV